MRAKLISFTHLIQHGCHGTPCYHMELYSTPHFTQIGQEMWDLQLEINLHSGVKYV
jgi:hypothetical protein